MNYDASTTNLTYYIPAPSSVNSTSSLEIVLSFLSPITPTSTLRQSIPASYLSIHIKGDFNVTIYVDLNGQWVSGDRNNHITWDFQQQSFKNGDGLNTFRVQRKEEQMLTEHDDRAEWGTMHFTGPKVSLVNDL